MASFEVTIDRMTLELFEFWLSIFWRTTFGPFSSRKIIEGDGIETVTIEVVGFGFSPDDVAVFRANVRREKYHVHFQLEERQGHDTEHPKPEYRTIGGIAIAQHLSDQVQIYCGGVDGESWPEHFASFLVQMFGVIPQELPKLGGISSPYPILQQLFNQSIESIAQGEGTIKEKVQKIDDFTLDSFLGFRLSDDELARLLGSTPATIHGYRKPRPV